MTGSDRSGIDRKLEASKGAKAALSCLSVTRMPKRSEARLNCAKLRVPACRSPWSLP